MKVKDATEDSPIPVLWSLSNQFTPDIHIYECCTEDSESMWAVQD